MNTETETLSTKVEIQLPQPIYDILKKICDLAGVTIEEYLQHEIKRDLGSLEFQDDIYIIGKIGEQVYKTLEEANWR